MNAVPAAYAEFGQTLAFTERTMTVVLRDHLAQRDVEPETWYALKLVAVGGPHVARSSLVRDLEGSRGSDEESTRALLARLAVEGLIAGDETVDLTEEGRVMFESLRDHVLGATVDLLGQFDLRDVETTVRTLKAITRRTPGRGRVRGVSRPEACSTAKPGRGPQLPADSAQPSPSTTTALFSARYRQAHYEHDRQKPNSRQAWLPPRGRPRNAATSSDRPASDGRLVLFGLADLRHEEPLRRSS